MENHALVLLLLVLLSQCISCYAYKSISLRHNSHVNSKISLRQLRGHKIVDNNIVNSHEDIVNVKLPSLKNDNGDRKSMKMHRLVALCFIPNPLNKETVNHKDHNKLNNHLDNLEWASTTEQNNHKRKCNN